MVITFNKEYVLHLHCILYFKWNISYMNVKIMPKKVIFVKWYEKGRSVGESAITFYLTAEILLKKI